MPAIDRFRTNMGRAEKALSSQNPEEQRYAAVLGVAAMDDYFTRKFCDKLVSFIKKKGITSDLEKTFEKTKFGIKEALELLVQATLKKNSRPWRIVRSHIEKALSSTTTQRFSKIDELFIAYGRKDLTENSVKKMKSKECLKGLNIKSPYQKRIEELVQRRNGIVHEGDLDNHGKAKNIDQNWIASRLKAVRYFVECANEIIDD